MGRVRTCGPNKASKNERKTQINIEIRDFFHPEKCVCVCGGGGGGTSHSLSPSLPQVYIWYVYRCLNVCSD